MLCVEIRDMQGSKEIKCIEPSGSRNIGKPIELCGAPDDFTVWHMLFVAHMGSFDKPWKMVMTNILKCGSGKLHNKGIAHEKANQFLDDNGIFLTLKEDSEKILVIITITINTSIIHHHHHHHYLHHHHHQHHHHRHHDVVYGG